MNLGLLAPAMLWGLAGISIPVIIHLLNRRRVQTVDWGAMQFLDLGRRARRRFQLTELLLMAGRMLLLGLVALAVARPFLAPRTATAEAEATPAAGGERRDVVLILDGSDSMGRRLGGSTPRLRAIEWARRFVGRLQPGDSVALLVAKDRVVPLVEPPSVDRDKVDEALRNAPAARGSSDLPAALGEALRVLEAGRNPGRDVVILTDGQRRAWRPGETARWDLLRELHRRQPAPPRIWSVNFGGGTPEGADAAVGSIELARGLVSPGMPLNLRTTITNAGPEPAERTAELLVDGVAAPGQSQPVGPIPAGGKVPLAFRTNLSTPGAHLLTIRLTPGDDPLAANDEASRSVEVAAALPVLLVDGEPGAGPLGGEADFLRAALAPQGDDTPQVRTATVRADQLTAEALKGRRVCVLANVPRLEPAGVAALAGFIAGGGGLLVAPGDRVDARFYERMFFQDGDGWLPARLGARKGDADKAEAIAHPAPRSFSGPALSPFGQGDRPPLGDADLFTYFVLEPAAKPPAGAVVARLDNGDPWIVERPHRDGRVLLLAGPVDAEGGTLPVNPDFVPLAHELVFHLAERPADARTLRPGEPIVVDLDPAPPAGVAALDVLRPGGVAGRAPIDRADGRARARFDDTSEPGIYRVALPDGFAYFDIPADPKEADPEPLADAEAAALAQGWPLAFEADPAQFAGRLLATGGRGPRPFWRLLVLAALAGLCLEVWMTRRLVRNRGIATADE